MIPLYPNSWGLLMVSWAQEVGLPVIIRATTQLIHLSPPGQLGRAEQWEYPDQPVLDSGRSRLFMFPYQTVVSKISTWTSTQHLFGFLIPSQSLPSGWFESIPTLTITYGILQVCSNMWYPLSPAASDFPLGLSRTRCSKAEWPTVKDIWSRSYHCMRMCLPSGELT